MIKNLKESCFTLSFLTALAVSFGLLIIIGSHLQHLPPPAFNSDGYWVLPSPPLERISIFAGSHNSQNADNTAVRFYSTTLRQGEGLSLLARQHNLQLATLLSVNAVSDLGSLSEGSEVVIPNQDGINYIVRRFDSLATIARRFEVSEDLLRTVNRLEDRPIRRGLQLFIPSAGLSSRDFNRIVGSHLSFPVAGNVRSFFGEITHGLTATTSHNYGLVFSTIENQTVHAAADGVVTQSGFHSSFGFYVVLDHGHLQSFYGYLNRPALGINSRVRRGDVIATVGRSGLGNGRSLYFSLLKDGKAVDPLLFLK
ncbi:MAG: peptidoglycan DD-metalloendopeptidase family protein [Spirochaetaceae bacterium]|nr:peptidoglycan DD-metalloendopeptidase family protein [Spirochaetaceae bacterium]